MSPSIMQDDVDTDYWLTEHHEIQLGDCVKRAEIHLSPSEQRGRWQTIQEALEETAMHPVQPVTQYGPWLCMASMIVSLLTVLLAIIAIAQVILLPDATVWPLGVAALICAGAAAGLGWVGVRGLE